MTRQELAEKVNLAYDQYFDAIQELGTAAGIMPPSPRLVGEDPRTSKRAKELWAEFQVEQTDINQEHIRTPSRRNTRRKTRMSGFDIEVGTAARQHQEFHGRTHPKFRAERRQAPSGMTLGNELLGSGLPTTSQD